MSTSVWEASIVEAEQQNATEVLAGEPIPAEVVVNENQVDHAVPVTTAVVEKKQLLTVTIQDRSVFVPEKSFFVGVGNPSTRYQNWLETKLKTALGALGNEVRDSNKQSDRIAHARAVQFISTICHFAKQLDNYEKVRFVYKGTQVRLKINFDECINNTIAASKDILVAIESMYRIEPQTID